MEKLLNDLQSLVAVNSISVKSDSKEFPFGKEVERVLETALSICKGYGFSVSNCEHMTGYAEAGKGDDIIGVLVHLDVVPAGEGWTHSPFSVEIENGKIFGRGVSDDKGPAVAVIHAIKELVEEGFDFKKRVRIIFGLGEETGDWRDLEYYKANEEPVAFGFTPDADFPAIYAEMGIANVDLIFRRDETCFAEISGGSARNMVPGKCSAVYMDVQGRRCELTVNGKSAHGSTPWDGENALCKMMNQISDNRACELIRFFRECVGNEYNGRKLGGYAADKKSGEIIYNYGVIETEDEEIILKLNIRYPVTVDFEKLLYGIKDSLKNKGFVGVNVKLISDRPYVFMDKTGPVITKLLDAYRKHTGDLSEPLVIGGGTYARAMKGIVAFGPMFPGRELTEHQPDEYMFMEDLLLAKEIYKTAIRSLATE